MALTVDKFGVPALEAHLHMKGTRGDTHELSTYHFFRCVRLPEATGYAPPSILLLGLTDVKKRRKKVESVWEANVEGSSDPAD